MGFILSGMFLRDWALYWAFVVVVLCGHLFILEDTPADPRLSEEEMCSYREAQSLIRRALGIEQKIRDRWFLLFCFVLFFLNQSFGFQSVSE